ncbi:MAG: hypothetical protein QOF73_3174, partial [Thermomicrobiales bacterium]|nr:hypothetical protein [Thermomicrobiales bacterium]
MSSAPHPLSGAFGARQVRGGQRWISAGLVARAASRALMISLLFLVAGTAGLGLYASAHADRYYEGVTVAGVPLGGLTRTEARARLQNEFAAYLDSPMTLVAGDQRFTLDWRVSGASLNLDETLRSSFAFGRDGSLWSRTRAWARAVVHGRNLLLTVNLDQARLDALLAEIAPVVTRPASNASIDMAGASGPTIVTESPGVALDLTTTRGLIVDRLRRLSHEPVALVTPEVAPTVTAADLQSELGQAQTAVASSLLVTGLGTSWDISQEDLKRIVSIRSGGAIDVDRQAVKTLVKNIAEEIERPSIDASLDVSSDGTITAVPGGASVEVETKPSIEAIVSALQGGQHLAELAIDQRAPAISDEQSATAAERANALVGSGFHLTWNGGSAELGRADLLFALTIDVDPGSPSPFTLGFDRDALALALAPLADQIDQPAKDATFRLVRSRVTVVEKAATGRELDVEAAVEAIVNAAMSGGPRELPLVVRAVKPTYADAYAKKIKVADVIGASSTSYAESSDARRHNVEQAAKLETGWLVPPGGQFSYAQHVGMVTKKEGFVTGFGIVASAENDGSVTTAPVVGGGICQVSTTIFQAAFWAGLQIDERHTHPYWLQAYGEPPHGMKGLDAMVNIEEDWTIDMRFTNTT